MKKAFFVIGMIGSVIVMFNSCAVGSFKTLNACWDFNNSVSSNKYLNAIIGFILIPFEVTIGGFCDVVIFNSVEFWTGSNPLAATKIIYYKPRMDTNAHEFLTTKHTKHTKVPRRYF